MKNIILIDQQEAASALSYIDSTNRELWIRMGMAVKSEFGDAGFDLWDQWSRSASNYNAGAAKSVWRSIREGGGVSIASLIREAIRAGWKPAQPIEPPTAEQIAQMQAERKAAQEFADSEKKIRNDQAAAQAQAVWDAATDCADHQYLTRKGVKSFGLRVGRWTKSNEETGEIWLDVPDALLVPIREGKKIVSIQAIFPEKNAKTGRDKDFLSGGKKRGCFFTIGKPVNSDAPVIICEGYATGASIHEATGQAVVVAFDAGNLVHSAEKIRAANPDRKIIIAADDDYKTPDNPGIKYAMKAARAVGATVAVPKRTEGTDFNDMHLSLGLDAVAACFIETAEPDAAPAIEQFEESAPEPDYGDDYMDALLSDHAAVDPIFIYKSMPADTARKFIEWLPADCKVLFWRDDFYKWSGCRYQPCCQVELHQQLYTFMESCYTTKKVKGGDEVSGFTPDRTSVENVMHALRAGAFCSISEPPCWIEPRENDYPANEFIAFKNGYLHWPTRTLYPSSPRMFCISALDFDYDPAAPYPSEWGQFLFSMFPDDQQSSETIAEMFGYMLTDDTSQQKAFMMIGPPRCGKGTILRILEAIVGRENRVSPSLSSLGTQFGLQPLIGKRVALISDARLSGKADQQPIVENILRITGEDAISADRKNKEAWTGRIQARFVLASNEIPAFSDSSAALANRFVMMRFNRSFLGVEDNGLTARLLSELPGIVLWALDGLERLRKRGYFVTPESAAEQMRDMINQSSPLKMFLDDCCDIRGHGSVRKDDLYLMWCEWCDSEGRSHPGTKSSFGRALHAALPTVTQRRIREYGFDGYVYDGISKRQTI